jgi:hypothetical protein
MPDYDIFTDSLHGGWRKVYRAFVGRQLSTHELACISEALRGCVGSGISRYQRYTAEWLRFSALRYEAEQVPALTL